MRPGQSLIRRWVAACAIAAVLGLGLSLAASSRCPVQTPSTARLDASDVLSAHNQWRAGLSLAPLRWSAELEASATRWAVQLAATDCKMAHRGWSDRPEPLGENIFWAAPLRVDGRAIASFQATAGEVVDLWGAEVRDYDYASNRCAAGKRCGHYTQLVWAATKEVGCGRGLCADGAQIWVCHYRPAGNVEGQRPY
jgi:pathogenesis-related protein 1